MRLSGGALTRTSARVIEANQRGQTYAAKVPGRASPLVFIDFSIEYVQDSSPCPRSEALTDRSSPEPDDRSVGTAVGLILTLCLAIPASLH